MGDLCVVFASWLVASPVIAQHRRVGRQEPVTLASAKNRWVMKCVLPMATCTVTAYEIDAQTSVPHKGQAIAVVLASMPLTGLRAMRGSSAIA